MPPLEEMKKPGEPEPAEKAPPQAQGAKSANKPARKSPKARLERIESMFDGLEVEPLLVEKPRPAAAPNPTTAQPLITQAEGITEPEAKLATPTPEESAPETSPEPPSPISDPERAEPVVDEDIPVQAPIPAPAIFHPRTPSPFGTQSGSQVLESQAEGEDFRPVRTPLNPQSLITGQPVIQPAGRGQPAMMSFPVKETATQEKTDLTLEFLDDDPERTWSEDEILLVEQVSSQLSLALENARLFEESRSRAEQLAVLNEMSRNLSSQLDVEQVLETIYRYTSLLIDTTNLYVALVRSLPDGQTEISFPLAVEDGVHQEWPSRPLGNGLSEYVIQTRQPLLIPEDVFGFLTQKLKIDPVVIGRPAQCWLGVPMIYGDNVGGVIAVQNLDQPNSLNEGHLELLNAIASQAAVAIENARLYSEEQRRRQIADALSGIARSVSSTLDLEEIAMSMLNQLANLIEFQSATLQLIENTATEKGIRTTRRVIGEKIYTQPGETPRPQAAVERLHRPVEDDALIMEVLRTRKPLLLPDTHSDARWEVLPETAHVRSWVATPLLGSPAGSQIATQARMTAAGQRSTESPAASRGESPVVGLLIIDHIRPNAYDQATLDLIATVAAQVSLGIQNARLFQQTQIALSETEALYQASAELNAVQSFDDILRTLRQYSILGEADSLVNLSIFNRPWSGDAASGSLVPSGAFTPPEWLIPVAHWTRLPLERLRQRYSLRSFPVARLLSSMEPLVIEDIANDTRLQGDEGVAARKLYMETFEGRSTIFSPLFVGGRWIGLINAVFSQAKHFDEDTIRRLIALSGQAAIAVQNLNSIQLAQQRAQEAQERSEELGLINRVMSGVASTLNLKESLDIITTELGNALRALTGVALIENIPTDGSPTDAATGSASSSARRLRVVSSYSPIATLADGSNIPSTVGMLIPMEGNLSTLQVLETRRPLLVQDPQNDPITASIHDVLRSLDCRALLILPLIATEEGARQVIGTVAAEIIGEERSFTQEEQRLAETIVLQASTAIQNSRLFEQNLRLLEDTQRTASQLQTAAEIARDTSSTLALDTLLQRTANQIRERFGYYHVSIFLLDESEEYAIVRESTGDAGDEMKRRSHRLPVGSLSVIGQVTSLGEPLVINDVTNQAGREIHRPNPLLPLTAAELGVPLKIGEQVIGALDVQASRANAFGPEDIAVIRVLADQIAIAVDNARSYELTQKAVEEIREADRLKSQFLANMSHELRTPLNSIIGFSRVILKGIDGPINEQQQQDLSAIYNSGQHLLGLINDVLDLSKIEAGKMELAFEENVALNDIVRGVMSTTMGLVRDKPITLQQEIAPDLPRLRIDAMKVRQVLLNLLSNAAKFTDHGSITVAINTRPIPGEAGQREVLVRVIDTGPGISAEDQAKLFQPFSQVDGSLTRKTGGSGLGLSISQHFVHMHGGEIGLESEVGNGTTFWFTLPAPPEEELALSPVQPPATVEPELPVPAVSQQRASASHQPVANAAPASLPEEAAQKPVPEAGAPTSAQVIPSQPVEQSQAPVEQAAPASAGSNPTGGIVLAIDKDPQVVNLYRRYLANQSMTVIALNELDQAVTVASGIMPRAITLDVAMQSNKETQLGILDGWQVLKGLKINPATKNIPVIICSLAVDQEKAFRMGAGAVLLKPILEEDLTRTLQRLIG